MGFNSAFKGLMKLELSRHTFEKYSNIKFHENPSSCSLVVPCGRTQTHMTKLKSRFSQFCGQAQIRVFWSQEGVTFATILIWPMLERHGIVIPRLTKIIRSEITFVSRNVMLSGVSLLAVSNVNNPVGLVGLLYVMWSAHFFVTHIQTEKISSWNGPNVHVCSFTLARASTKTFVSRIHIR